MSVLPARQLPHKSVALIVKNRIALAGLDARRYSGHSLRAGLVTSAAKAGVPIHRIQAQSRHASLANLSRYIRDARAFEDNALAALL
jgi:integrase